MEKKEIIESKELDDMDTTNTEGLSEEQLKKKHQNSVRWKRWWLKNREAYNEKRRLSAQLRSAKNRELKEKSMLARQQQIQQQQQQESEEKVGKRLRMSSEEPPSADYLPAYTPDITAQPPFGLNPFMQHLPSLGATHFQGNGINPLQMLIPPASVLNFPPPKGPFMERYYPAPGYLGAPYPIDQMQYMYNMPNYQQGGVAYSELARQLPTTIMNLK